MHFIPDSRETKFRIIILEKKMEIIELKHGNSSAQVYSFGATVTSWKQNGKEKLFLSSTGNEI